MDKLFILMLIVYLTALVVFATQMIYLVVSNAKERKRNEKEKSEKISK